MKRKGGLKAVIRARVTKGFKRRVAAVVAKKYSNEGELVRDAVERLIGSDSVIGVSGGIPKEVVVPQSQIAA